LDRAAIPHDKVYGFSIQLWLRFLELDVLFLRLLIALRGKVSHDACHCASIVATAETVLGNNDHDD
jgi:hypothetical protein